MRIIICLYYSRTCPEGGPWSSALRRVAYDLLTVSCNYLLLCGFIYLHCRSHDFFLGGIHKKPSKTHNKICLYPFLLRFYESNKHFGGGSNPLSPWIRPCLFSLVFFLFLMHISRILSSANKVYKYLDRIRFWGEVTRKHEKNK
jgi:hypothetical protein